MEYNSIVFMIDITIINTDLASLASYICVISFNMTTFFLIN